MKFEGLNTPIYVKTEKEFPWPEDKVFYLLTRDGLFIGRNHGWFQSLAPAKRGPGELEEQSPLCRLSYPKIPRLLLEKAVGFFAHIYEDKHWECAVILVWNKVTQQVELLCPDQKCSCGCVKYDIPILPPHLVLMGDIHSHCDFDAFSSGTDKDDETHRPGIHLIIGKITEEPPVFHCECVVDGTRFEVPNLGLVIEDYIQRDTQVPPEWVAKVKAEYTTNYSYHGGGYSGTTFGKPSKDDKVIIQNILDRFLRSHNQCPEYEAVRQKIYVATKNASYLYCEKRAKQFIDAWPKAKAKFERLCKCGKLNGQHSITCPVHYEDTVTETEAA